MLFVSKKKAIEALDLSGETLKRYRLHGEWIEGIHWVRINSRCVRYNLELIQDWCSNRNDPITHMRAIEAYKASLLSGHKRTLRNRSEDAALLK
jgi:CHAD domain-containing protein